MEYTIYLKDENGIDCFYMNGYKICRGGLDEYEIPGLYGDTIVRVGKDKGATETLGTNVDNNDNLLL